MAHVLTITHGIAAAAFVALLGLLYASRAQHRYKRLLVLAGGANAIWALAVCVGSVFASPAALWIPGITAFEQARTLGWASVTAFVLFVAYRKQANRLMIFGIAALMLSSAVYVIGIGVYAGVVGDLGAG